MDDNSLVPWDTLTQEQREPVILVLGSLTEFSAGFNLTTSFTQFVSNPQDPPVRFLYQSLHQYLYAYYLDTPDTGLLPVMRQIGLHKDVDHIVAVLDAPIGDTTVRAFMKRWRNVVMSHPRFSARLIHGVYNQAGIDDSDEEVKYFSDSLQQLLRTTWSFWRDISDGYPNAVVVDRLRHSMPVEQPPSSAS